MFAFRRASVRILSSSPSTILATKTRTFTSIRAQTPFLSTAQRISYLPSQRRFASEEAVTQSEPEADGAIEAQSGNNSIAAAAEESQESEPPNSKEVASAVSLGSVINETTAEDAGAPPPAVERSSGVLSKATTSIAGTAAEVGKSLSDTAGFDSNDGGQVQDEGVSRVYVGNLFFDVTRDDLSKHFEQAGQVVSARVVMDSRGLSKGFGFIEFENPKSATKAIELFDQQEFEGRRISVQFPMVNERRLRHQDEIKHQPRPLNEPSKTLFIGNMSFDMSDRELNNLFREIKNVVDVRVAIDRRTGQPRGFAHADFSDVGSAERAMATLRGKVVSGRSLRVDYSGSTGRASMGPPKEDV